MTTRMVTLDGPAGQPPRAARLDLPQGPARAAALMVQGLSAGADGPAARRIAGRLAAQGLAVLWLDLPAPETPDAETPAPEMPDATSLARLTEDLVAAAGWMAGQGLAPGVLIGHALGGAAVLGAAGRIPSARAVVTLGAPFEPALGPAIGHLHRALLVLHAPRDPVVGIEHAARIFERARHPKSFVTLDTADHLISNPQDAEYAAGVIVAWALRYLELAAPDPLPGVYCGPDPRPSRARRSAKSGSSA